MPYEKTVVFFLLTFFLFACKKKESEEILSPEPDPIVPALALIVNEIKVDSVEQLAFTITYKLSTSTTETGINFDFDSLNLVNNKSTYEWQSVLNNGSFYARPELWSYAPQDKFWYRIYYKDESGKKIYTQIYKQDLPKYSIRNEFIVCGKEEYNSIGSFDNLLVLVAYNSDNNLQNYSAKINGISTPASKFETINYNKNHKNIIFDVPENLPLGPAKFQLYYLGKLDYETEITIVNGGLLTKTKHPLNIVSGQFFTHEKRLYTLTGDITGNMFYSWEPINNVWTKLPNPPVALAPSKQPAHSIQDLIYFPPISVSPWGFTDFYYDELVWTFNPETNKWNKITLYHTTEGPHERRMEVQASVVYENKIYCIIRESAMTINPVIEYNKTLIKVFDPLDNSWKELMALNDANIWSYRACVLDNQIYILKAVINKQVSASTDFTNEMFVLDINNKTLIKKNWIDEKEIGVSNPYFVPYKGKIYAYGGLSSSGYFSTYSSLFAVYDPIKNKWQSLSNYGYYTARVSQTDGFLLELNDKLYLGLGYDRYSNGGGSDRNSLIFNLDIR